MISTTKRQSATDKTLAQYAINKQRIERMLHWTPLEYGTHQWNAMEAYILASGLGDAQGLELQGKSTEYRKWWINQWNIRDIVNTELLEGCSTTADARMLYQALHNANYLLTYFENSEALQTSEAYAVGRAIDEYHQAKNKKSHAK
jgi:hypothetical protein